MGDLGLSSTFAVGAMQQSVRQRIMDQLQRQAQAHQMGVEDQRLEFERQRLAQDAADRSLLRNQQASALNESIGEKAAANLGPGQTVLTPYQAEPILNAPSMRGRITLDQSLPSTSIVSGMLAPTTEITPGTQGAGTQPLVTQQAPTLTGQLRFFGTPKANQDEAARVLRTQLLADPSLTSQQRLEMQAESAGLKAPTREPKQTARVIAVPGPNGGKIEKSFTEDELAAGVPAYVAPTSSPQAESDAQAIAQAIMSGKQPPETRGLFRLAGPVRAHLAEMGYDLSTANLDWDATKRHLASLNGPQQTRLRQAIGTASDSLDVIQRLADQWDAGRFPLLNKANVALAKGGAYGRDAASIATQLEGQITDVISELSNVYMGGNSPTDHALKLAEKNLSANWDRKVLTDMIALARTNIKIRENSILNSPAITASTQAAPSAAPTVAPPKVRTFNPATGRVE